MAASMQLGGAWQSCHRPTPQSKAFTRTSRVIARAQEEGNNFKRAAAQLLVDTFVKDGMTVGLGTGELCSLCTEELGMRIAKGKLRNVRAVPSSDQAAATAAFHGVPLPLQDLTSQPVDVAFDQADQLDVEGSACVMGVASEPQQPQLLRALTMAQTRAKQFVVLVEEKNVVDRLQGTLPVVIDHATWEETAEEVDDLVIGDAEVWRRATPGSPNPNPRGGEQPYVSSEGHNLIDLKYDGKFKLFGDVSEPYHKLEEELMQIDGVVATGLLMGVACAAVIASPSGPRVVELAVDKEAAAVVQAQQQQQQS